MEQHVPSTFAELGVPADIVARLAGRGIDTAFPIQEAAIPAAIAGQDVCGRAPTGSGKTLAFGIPLAQRVGRAKVARPKALVLAPTRELAAQIHKELTPLLALRGRSIATFYGGVGFVPQLKVLRRGVDVAVACPGRLNDLINRGVVKLDDVEIVVVDEADRMADMGFLPEVRRFLDLVKPDRQTLLFSATLDGDVDVLIRNYQRDPVRCEVAATEEEDHRTTHLFLDAKRDQRASMTAELVSRHDSAIVFCRTKHGADRLAEQLARSGVSTVAIHGNRSQAQRDRALAAFAARRVQALVATDVAARGIHVDQVGVVVHFDPPADAKDYVHRSGRTGRAGAVGTVVSFVTEGDGGTTRKLQKTLGLEVTASAGPPPRGKKAFPKAAPVSRPTRSGGRPSQKPAGSVRKAHARPPRGRFR